MSDEWDSNEEIQRLREYLRIPSVHPNVDYGDCVKFLKKQAVSLNLPIAVHELVPKKPIVVITWKGLQPDLPSIMVNSHMDVVPVYEVIVAYLCQYSQVYDKRQPYETDIKVPLLMKGPGLKKNVLNHQPVLNIDIAPTVIQLAGLEVPKSMDGRPINFGNEGMEERNMLIEYFGEGSLNTVDENCPWVYDGDHLAQCHPKYDCKCQDSKNNTYACVRHMADRINMKYCMFADNEKFSEMYNLATDPYELKNIINNVFPLTKHWYKLILSQMLLCKGATSCDNPLQDSAFVFF